MPRSSTRARYTRAQKAQAVAAATLTSVEAAADTQGIPRSTLRYWMDDPEFNELRQRTRDEVADTMWATIQLGIAEVAKGLRDPDAPLRDKVVALGVLYDKRALLTGDATSRSENRDITGTLSDRELIDAIREAERLAGGAGTAEPAPAAPEG